MRKKQAWCLCCEIILVNILFSREIKKIQNNSLQCISMFVFPHTPVADLNYAREADGKPIANAKPV